MSFWFLFTPSCFVFQVFSSLLLFDVNKTLDCVLTKHPATSSFSLIKRPSFVFFPFQRKKNTLRKIFSFSFESFFCVESATSKYTNEKVVWTLLDVEACEKMCNVANFADFVALDVCVRRSLMVTLRDILFLGIFYILIFASLLYVTYASALS